MKQLNKVKELVKNILTESENTRNSDDLLYITVCKRINPIAASLPFYMVLGNRKEYGIPSFESVSRARRKIQEENPDLCGTDTVEAYRKVNEETFREFATGRS